MFFAGDSGSNSTTLKQPPNDGLGTLSLLVSRQSGHPSLHISGPLPTFKAAD
jgi:hypothetical protein